MVCRVVVECAECLVVQALAYWHAWRVWRQAVFIRHSVALKPESAALLVWLMYNIYTRVAYSTHVNTPTRSRHAEITL